MKIREFNSDWLNPVLVKEVRQFFHNKLFFSLVGGLLGLQLLVLIIFNLTASEWKDSRDAGTIFIIIDTILMYVCVFGTAAWGALQRFYNERSSKELDIANITLLTPLQIVGGKLASSLVIWALIAALCLPFMTVAYFFRNITPGEIVTVFGLGVVPMLIVIQSALFCGALGKKWGQAVFGYSCFQLLPIPVASIAAIFEGSASWEIFWLLQGGGFLFFLILFAATVALLTPPFANRMFALRLMLVIFLLPLLALTPFVNGYKQEIQMIFCCFPIGIFAFLAFLNCCDRDEPGNRVLAQVPRNIFLRTGHYLLSSNRTGGVVLGVLLLMVYGIEMLIMSTSQSTSLLMLGFSVGAYALFYSELAIFMNRKVPELPGWGWFLIICILLGLFTMVAAVGEDIDAVEIWTSPISLFNEKGMPQILKFHFWAAPLAALVCGLPFVGQMLKRFKDYKAPLLPRE